MVDRRLIGRERELSILEKEYRRHSSLALLYGREGMGKTSLLKEFIRGKDALYLRCTGIGSEMAMRDFSPKVAEYNRTPGASYQDIGEIVKYICLREGRKLLIVDDFQFLVGSDTYAMDKIAEAWTTYSRNSMTMVVLVVSDMLLAESLIKDRRNPLHNGFTLKMHLGPLPFNDVKTDDYIQSLGMYVLHGGVPALMAESELIGDEQLFGKFIDPESAVFRRMERIVSNISEGSSRYLSVLRSVSAGNGRVTDIASDTGIPVTSLMRPIGRLETLGVMERIVPTTEHPKDSRNGMYRVCDQSIGTWCKYVLPNMSDIMVGEKDGAIADWLARRDEDALDAMKSEAMRMLPDMVMSIGFIPGRIGGYWDRNGNSIDILLINRKRKTAFAADCVFSPGRPLDMHCIDSLEDRCSRIEGLEKFQFGYGLFSVSGFDDDMYDNEFVLVDKGRVVDYGF